MGRQPCMPPQQISPSAARRSPYPSAIVHASVKVATACFWLPSGSLLQFSGLSAVSIRMTPYGRTPSFLNFSPMMHDFFTMSRNRPRSSLLPNADPPEGGHTGATMEPITRFFSPKRPAHRFRSSSVESMSMCGRERKTSMPSNFAPFASAFAVRSIMVSSSMTGSEPSPFPTIPGQPALCSLG